MRSIRRLQIPALFCSLAVLLCELIARPYTSMSVSDDGPYILIAQKLANTGHIVYNGVTTPMLGWQLYLGAAFIKLFGFSFTTVRRSTLLVAMALAYVLQRTLVRAGIRERNATIGTLALVLSPLYLELSATFMTDIFGLFAIVVCLYGCICAVQAATDRSAIAWLCFAAASNAIGGSSRQIAWLGVLVMVPSVLWLLRSRRRVVLAGAAANLVGALFVLGCMLWFFRQPYNVHEPLLPGTFPVVHTLSQLTRIFLDIPFLLLPITALFIPQIRRYRAPVLAVMGVVFLMYLRFSFHRAQLHYLEPTLGDWVNGSGGYQYLAKGEGPIFFSRAVRLLLTLLSFGGLFGVITSLCLSPRTQPRQGSAAALTWKQLAVLLVPFTAAYSLLLVPRATTAMGAVDRYLLPLLVVVLLCLVRYYQDRIQPRLSFASVILVGIMAIYGVAITHNLFSLYRARVVFAAELRDRGIPDTSVDNGWEYNFDVELEHSSYINDYRMVLPAHAHVPVPAPSAGVCDMYWFDRTPHIHPLYGISFDPNACYGPAPFAPVQYSRWLASSPGALYAVRYTAASKP